VPLLVVILGLGGWLWYRKKYQGLSVMSLFNKCRFKKST